MDYLIPEPFLNKDSSRTILPIAEGGYGINYLFQSMSSK